MRLSKMQFFLCFRPTIKFQGGSPVDPLFEPLPTSLLTRPLKNYFYRHFGVSENYKRWHFELALQITSGARISLHVTVQCIFFDTLMCKVSVP